MKETIGTRIRLLMHKHNMSEFELAEKIGVSRKTIYFWEADRSEPKSTSIGKMAKIFGVTCDYLINGNS